MFKRTNSMALIIFTKLCNSHCRLFPKTFSSPPLKKNSHPLLPGPGSLHSAFYFYGFAMLCFSYKWNHTLPDPSCLAYFTWHKVFQVRPCCSVRQNFIPFYWWITFHCVDTLRGTYPLMDTWRALILSLSMLLWTSASECACWSLCSPPLTLLCSPR